MHFQAARHPEKRALYPKGKSNEPQVFLFRGKAEAGESRFMQRRTLGTPPVLPDSQGPRDQERVQIEVLREARVLGFR